MLQSIVVKHRSQVCFFNLFSTDLRYSFLSSGALSATGPCPLPRCQKLGLGEASPVGAPRRRDSSCRCRGTRGGLENARNECFD